VTNTGTIEVVNGGGTGSVIFGGKASGAGVYSLQYGRMVFRVGLVMPEGGRIDDHAVSSAIEVSGNLSKQGSATNGTAVLGRAVTRIS